ncbi:MAG: VOC family protein [Longimicrobiales bacterium]
MPVEPIPTGHRTVTPYLVVADAGALIEFLKRAFGAVERHRTDTPDGRVMHAEVEIGDSIVMLGEAGGEWQPMPSVLHLYVTDTDAVYARAIEAGATALREPEDQFYGDRSGGVQDPAGNQWWIATHVEDVSPEEMERRMAAQRSG